MFLKYSILGGVQMHARGDETAHAHGYVDLCADGSDLYARALRTGRIARSEVEVAPCLVDLALLRPDSDDPKWLRPAPPSAVLARLTHPLEEKIWQQRQRSLTLVDTFEPFLHITAQDAPVSHAITVLEGISHIDAAVAHATAECQQELLTLTPGGSHNPHSLSRGIDRVGPLIERGVRIRMLYHHTARHSQGLLAYQERIGRDRIAIRTLEELTDRLIIVDRAVAFIPARADRKVALELRHPGLTAYLAGVFDQFWRLATPLEEEIHYEPQADGITGVQRSVAKLLVEGHLDETIARRLGMNIRTCRSHIAKLGATLGSSSRAQLGYLIARSGIVDDN